MCGYGFDNEDVPSWWIDNVLESNQAQGIVEAFERGLLDGEYDNPLYLGFCIIVLASPFDPGNLSYVIQHLSMWEDEGIALLRLMAKINIPAHTEVTYPEYFLQSRYKERSETYQYLRETLSHWSVQIWEDYCGYLMAEHGQGMFSDYLERANALKNTVKDTVKNSSKPLIFTEGETDVIYIETALDLLGFKVILDQVTVKWVGASTGQGKSINAGDSGLNSTRNVLLANPEFIKSKVLLLYDFDTRKRDADYEKLMIRAIPKREHAKVKKGIENLLPDELFTPEFYSTKTKQGAYGEEQKIQEFQKMKFCRWICQERRQAKDFRNFKPVIDIVRTFLDYS
jgi:hypothetical protein